MNNIVKFKCPHCQNPLAFRKPEASDSVHTTCPNCKNGINIKIQEKPVRLPGQDSNAHSGIARLVMEDGPQSQKTAFALRRGSNIIGRKDIDTVQDIAIDGDNTISRRSLELQVGLVTGGGLQYHLKVLNAKNPVLVNGNRLNVGDAMPLRLGDTIILGITKLKLSV